MIVIFRGFAVHDILKIGNKVSIRVCTDGNTFGGVILNKFNRLSDSILSATTVIVANIPTIHVEVFNNLVVEVFDRNIRSLLLTL